MERGIASLRDVFSLSVRTGLTAGAVAYGFVFGFAGIDTLLGGSLSWRGEIWLAFQYACLALGYTILIAILASSLAAVSGTVLTRKGYLAAVGGIFIFTAVFLPSELSWLLSHRPINPASREFLVASAGRLLVSVAAGAAVAAAVSRFAGASTRFGSRAAVVGALLVVPAGFLCGRLLLLPPSGDAGRERDSRKVVIIGLDGGTWSLIDPMMARGELPNLKWLVGHGASGTLESLVPIESPRVWTSIATGKTPDKHGIDRFIIDRRFIRTATVWDIADDAGKRVGLYDWLVTYPPKAINGFVVPGWLAGGKSDTYPDKLGRSLFVVRSLRHPFWFVSIAGFRLPLGYLEQARGNPIPRTINSQFVKSEFKQLDVPYLRAAHDTDVFAVVFYGSDVLAHSMWQFMEPDHFPDVDPVAVERYGDALPSYYRLVDGAIGTIREQYGKNTTFFVVSDHGFRRATTLDRMNYIVADTLLSDMGLSDVAQNVGGAKDHAIVALRPSLGLSESDNAELAEKIIASVNVIESTDGKRVFRSEPMEEGKEIRISMHADLDPNDDPSLRIGGKVFPLSKYLQQAVLSGDHDIEGIVIIQGPEVRPDHRLSGARVIDIAPTILYSLGLPVGRDMDGEVLTDAFTPTTLSARGIETIESYDLRLKQEAPPERPDVDPELMERLRSLGYLQ